MLIVFQILIGASLLVLTGCELWVFLKSTRGVNKKSFLFLNLANLSVLLGYLWLFLKKTPAGSGPGFFILAFGIVFIPPLWILYTTSLGREDSKAELKKVVLNFAPFLILSFFFLFWHLKGGIMVIKKDIFGEMVFYFSQRGKLFLAFLLSGAILSILNLESTFRSTIVTERKRLMLPLISSLALLGLLIYLVTAGFMGEDAPITSLVFLSWGILGSFWAISLCRYFRERIESIQISRQAVYSSAILILIGGYLIIVGLIARVMQSYGINLSVFLSILAAFLVIAILSALVVSSSIRERLRKFIDQSFYKGKVDYRVEWSRFSENIAYLLDLEEILNEVVKTITSNLRVGDIIILLSESQGSLYLAYPKKFICDLKINKGEDFLDWVFRYGESVRLNEIEFDKFTSSEIRAFFECLEKQNMRLCVPMITKRNLVGLMFMGPKNDNQPFTEEDLSFLDGMAHQTSIAVLNSRLSQELILSREMESFNKLSSFILHDLKNFVSMLSLILRNAEERSNDPDFQKGTLVTISDTVARMKGLMSKLSSAPEGIRLDLKECNLNKILQDLLQNLKLSKYTRIKTRFDFKPLPATKCDQMQIERVFQNLIINAIEAMPEGGALVISTDVDSEAGWVWVEVSDTGMGMSRDFVRNQLFRPFETTKRKGLGIGLFQCKEIVELHNGKISVVSEEGKGTTFKVELPL